MTDGVYMVGSTMLGVLLVDLILRFCDEGVESCKHIAFVIYV